MTEAQLELLRDKYVLWERASRQGPMDSRDYNARCAEALKAALCILAASPAERSDPLRETDQSNPSLGTGGEGNQGDKVASRTNSGGTASPKSDEGAGH